MKTIGLVIGKKENEKRRALIPEHIHLIDNPGMICVEKGYGEVCGYTDREYEQAGCRVADRDEVFKCDIICDPKIGDAEYLEKLEKGKTIFGWIHAVQNRDITDKLIDREITAFAWEDMYKDERHTFFRNNELAGEAAVINAYECFGKMPYETKAAVIGNGNTARGAIKILTMLGADVTCYNRKLENLFKKEMYDYDVIVNCVLWDIKRKDHIIYRSDLPKLKKDAMIIDISCDRNGGIETSIPTTFEDPVYYVDGIMHYVVDHTPSLFHKDATKSISAAAAPFMDLLIKEEYDETLKNALIIENGCIKDKRINEFQNR